MPIIYFILIMFIVGIGVYTIDFFSGRWSKYKRWKRKRLGLCNHNWIHVQRTIEDITKRAWIRLPTKYKNLINWESYKYYVMPNVSFNMRWNSNLNYVCSICGKCHNGNSMYARWIFKKMKRDAKEKLVYEKMFKACEK